jgi:hypothetical protein
MEERTVEKCGGQAFVTWSRRPVQKVWKSNICGHGRQKTNTRSVEGLASVWKARRANARSAEEHLCTMGGKGHNAKSAESSICGHGKQKSNCKECGGLASALMEGRSDCKERRISFLRPWKERKSDCSEVEKLLYP